MVCSAKGVNLRGASRYWVSIEEGLHLFSRNICQHLTDRAHLRELANINHRILNRWILNRRIFGFKVNF